MCASLIVRANSKKTIQPQNGWFTLGTIHYSVLLLTSMAVVQVLAERGQRSHLSHPDVDWDYWQARSGVREKLNVMRAWVKLAPGSRFNTSVVKGSGTVDVGFRMLTELWPEV